MATFLIFDWQHSVIDIREQFPLNPKELASLQEGKDNGKGMCADVPQKNCCSTHRVDGRPCQFCHVTIPRDDTTTVQVLEIELTKDDALEAWVVRAAAKVLSL